MICRFATTALIVSVCVVEAAAQTLVGGSAPPAQRLGPGSETPQRQSRVIQVRQSSEPGTAPAAPAPPTAPDRDLADLEAKWFSGVVEPLAAARLGHEIELTQARIDSYEQRLAALREFNFYALPNTNRFQGAWVIPPASGIAPAPTLAPVQLFSPPSTFSHSMARAEQRLEEARLELAALVARRDAGDLSPEVATFESRQSLPDELTDVPADSVDSTLASRQVQIDAERRLLAYRQELLDRRLEQLNQFHALAYSLPNTEFAEELRLRRLANEQRLSELRQEEGLVAKHAETAVQLDRARARVARLSPPNAPR